jgi:hypothetical protein
MVLAARRSSILTLAVTGLLALTASAADDSLIVNGDFERGREGWSEFWSRTPGQPSGAGRRTEI